MIKITLADGLCLCTKECTKFEINKVYDYEALLNKQNIKIKVENIEMNSEEFTNKFKILTA